MLVRCGTDRLLCFLLEGIHVFGCQFISPLFIAILLGELVLYE